MKKVIGILGVVVLIALGVFYIERPETGPAPLSPQTDYKSISYEIDDQVVQLTDGVAETEVAPGSAIKDIARYFGNELTADLNHDGLDDVVFLLTEQSGGSGTFFYVVAALKTENGYRGTNGIFLGDRIAPQTTEFREGKIIVNYAERKPNEPMSAEPSVGVSKYLQIQDGRLVEIAR